MFRYCLQIVWGLSPDDFRSLLGYHQECKTETNIDDSLATGVFMGQFPDDTVLKQHMLCISKKLGYQNDDGKLQRDVIRDKFATILNDEDKANQYMEKCAVEQSDPEETAFQATKCFYESIRNETV
ncbi:hypothetical protein NQ318_008557 [Aromia moschata]|uniref:Uncharacterized protein n=1 Tax=Aromia moschata TaxID=1265417 RepID=A0AAV8YWF4_9CUCU|nr:hypothetical protein NQ318_008557 [Aromia moschata]